MGYGNTWIWCVFPLVCGFLCLRHPWTCTCSGLSGLSGLSGWWSYVLRCAMTTWEAELVIVSLSFHFHFLLDYTRLHIP